MKIDNKNQSRTAGLAPGTLIHIGEKKSESSKITLYTYDESHLEEKKEISIEECIDVKKNPKMKWINVDGIHDIPLLEKLGREYGIHPLVLEDILNTGQRPKVEDYGEYLYIVLKILIYNDQKNEIEVDQFSLILGSNFLLTFQEKVTSVFHSLLERLRSEQSRIRKLGVDYIAYALLDSITDHYFILLEKLGDWIEETEEELDLHFSKETINRIHQLRRKVLMIRKSIWPLRDMISSLGRGESGLIHENTELYIRDLHDHIIQVIDTLETYREMISGMHEIYLTGMSNRMNEVMKVLTIISTFFIPITFVSSIYGMNFKWMPELNWHWGYPAVLIFMGIISLIMFSYFKKKRWF